jgi:hypothetical protein
VLDQARQLQAWRAELWRLGARAMDDLSPYRVIVRARNKPGVGYTYVITRLDVPAWSQGTAIYYPSPEAAHEAGHVALESFIVRRASSKNG